MAAMARRFLRGLCVLAVAGTTAVVAVPASADGSPDLYPTNATCQPNSAGGQCRASLEWRTNTYGPPGSEIVRRTLIDVYAQTGEVLEMGSSAVGQGAADVVVWDPGQISDQQAATLPAVTSGVNGFACSVQRTASGVAAQGVISSRALELAGPQSADGTGNPSGYVPCSYVAPVTGVYQVAFYGPAGPAANGNGGPTGDINLASANDFSTAQGSSISAWDLTVRADPASASDISGRVFTYALAEFTAGNGRPVFQQIYVTTDDGYRYRVDTNGLDPNGFIMFGSRTGFLDPDGRPLDHDVTANAGGAAMSALDGGTQIAPPEFPLSFTPLSAATLGALHIPTTPTPPAISGLSFTGNIAANNSTVSGGGTFHYSANVVGNYEIVVSRDGVDFDPGNPSNKVLLGVGAAGTNHVTWDGLDNSGVPFPAGSNYQFTLGVHAGEYHFPELDAESSTLGGPTFTLLNPPGGNCPFGRSSCTTAFYDDRGYTTSAGDTVGTPGALLCGTNPPATSHSDPLTGFDSSSAQRAFGTDTGGNTNAPCTGAFGDVKGLDTWTYYPSNLMSSTLNILTSAPTPPAAVDDTGTVASASTLSVPAPGLLGNDSGSSIAVTTHTAPAHGSAVLQPDGSYTYTPATDFSGADSFSYTITDSVGQTATATVTITVTPVAIADSVTTVTGVPVTVDATANDHGSGLTLTSVGQPPAGQGTVGIVGGHAVYTPPPGFIGTVTLPYTTTDGSGGMSDSTITITVVPPAPVAVDDSGTVNAGSTLTVAAPGLMTNDSGTAITVTGNTTPAHGAVTVNGDGSYSYTPAPGFSGTDTFHYTVTDNLGRTATATVTITVIPLPPAPIARPDSGTTPVNTPLIVVAPGALSNDNGSTISVTGHTSPSHGVVVVQASGSYTYTPAAGYSGPDTFIYTITDAYGRTATATVTIQVTPVAKPDSATTPMGIPVTINSLTNDTGTQLTLTATTPPAHGSVSITNNRLVFTPPAGFTGTTTFTYTATDASGQSVTAQVTVTVGPAFGPPISTGTGSGSGSTGPTGSTADGSR